MGPHLLLLAAALLKAPPLSCPLTMPPDEVFVPPSPYTELAPFGAAWFGADSLWTVLPRGGVLYQTNKVFWWSVDWDSRRDPRPQLIVTARHLDSDRPAVWASRATNAHAADIGQAMLVGLELPYAGCWEVTGEYQGTTLSFVAWVPEVTAAR